MKLNKNVNEVIENLIKNGYEAYVVGGAVRDSIMQKEAYDMDVTTSATPLEVKSIFPKTFDTGIEHGTVTVVINHENIEVTTYRVDGEYLDNRRPKEVTYTKRLGDDLARRDYTMNAIAYSPYDGYVDLYGGIDDINKNIIRAVGVACDRYDEDSLRIFRGIRFSCQLGFNIEQKTYEAMCNKSYLVKNLSIERVRDELLKSINGKYIENLNLYTKVRVFDYIDENLSGFLDEKCGIIVNEILNLKCDDNISRLIAFFKFYPENELLHILKKLRLDNNTIKQIVNCVKCNEELNKYDLEEISDENIRVLINEYDEYLSICVKNKDDKFLDRVTYNRKYPCFVKELKINGQILIALGFKGKEIGDILDEIMKLVLANPSFNEEDKLINFAKNKH